MTSLKKILLIHHRLPFPLISGMDKARFSLIKLLNQKYHISLIVLNRDNLSDKDIGMVKNICSRLIVIDDFGIHLLKNGVIKKIRTLFLIIQSILFFKPVFVSNNYSKKFKRAVRKLINSEKFDVVQPLSDFSLDYLSGVKTSALKLYGPNDDMVGMTESIILYTDNIFEKLLMKIERRARCKWQEKIINDADNVFYFSKSDIKKILERNSENESKLIWMPGVIEHSDSWNKDTIYSVEKNTLIFTGGLVSVFNRISVKYFIHNVWPHVIREIENAKLLIVGQSNEDNFRKSLDAKNVYFTGRVESVRPYLEHAAVFISPVTCGTGIKTKVIEAFRFGKPVVSTPEGVSGLWALPEDTIKVTSTPVEFAKDIIKLLLDEEYYISVSLKSRKLYEEEYSFNKLLPIITGLYEKLLHEI